MALPACLCLENGHLHIPPLLPLLFLSFSPPPPHQMPVLVCIVGLLLFFLLVCLFFVVYLHNSPSKCILINSHISISLCPCVIIPCIHGDTRCYGTLLPTCVDLDVHSFSLSVICCTGEGVGKVCVASCDHD